MLKIIFSKEGSNKPGSYLASISSSKSLHLSSHYDYLLHDDENTKDMYILLDTLNLNLRMMMKRHETNEFVKILQYKLETFVTLLVLNEIFSGSLQLDRVAHVLYSACGGNYGASLENNFIIVKQPLYQRSCLYDRNIFLKSAAMNKSYSSIIDRVYIRIPNLLLVDRTRTGKHKEKRLSFSNIIELLVPKQYSEMEQIKQSLKDTEEQIFKHNELMYFLQILYVKYLDTSDTFAYRDTKRFLYHMKELRGEEVVFGKRLSKWIDLFIKRKIRFIERSVIDVHFNEIFEMHRLKIVHYDYANNNLEKDEMENQLWICMSNICKNFSKNTDYSGYGKKFDENCLQFICVNKTTFRSLKIPRYNADISNDEHEMRSLFNNFSNSIVRMYHYLVFEKNILNNTSLISCVIYCQRILISLIQHWKVINDNEIKKTFNKSFSLQLSITQWIPMIFQTSKQVLLKYGSQFVLVARSMKLLGNIYNMVVKINNYFKEYEKSSYEKTPFYSIEEEIILIFQNYLGNQLPKILLFYATKNVFPQKQYFEVLKGILAIAQSIDNIFPVDSDKEKIHLEPKYFDTLVSFVVSTPQYMDKWASRLREGKTAKNQSKKSDFMQPPQVNNISVDWKLQHARIIYLFSIRINKINCFFWAPNMVSLLVRECQKNLRQPYYLYTTLACIISMVYEKIIFKNEHLSKEEEELYKILEIIVNNSNFNIPEILTLLIQISTQLIEIQGKGSIIQDKGQFIKKVWNICLVPMFTEPLMATESGRIDLMKNSEFFSMRFLFINGISRMVKRDSQLIDQVLNDVEIFVRNITKQYNQHQNLYNKKDREREEKIFAFLGDISSSIITLLWKLAEPSKDHLSCITDIHCAQCIKIMSFLEMFRSDNLAYQETIRCFIERCNNTSHLIPTMELYKQLTESRHSSTLKYFRILFYIRLATILVKQNRTNQKMLEQRIIPLMFSCMKAYPIHLLQNETNGSNNGVKRGGNVWTLILQQCFQLFIQFFVEKNVDGNNKEIIDFDTLQNDLIPHFLNIVESKLFSLQKYTDRRSELLYKRFYEQSLLIIPKILPRLNSEMVEYSIFGLENFLIRKVDELATLRIDNKNNSDNDSIQRIKDEINLLFWVCVQCTMVVSSLDDLENILLPSISRIFKKLNSYKPNDPNYNIIISIKQLCFNIFYQIISKCMDYTRKQTCINFYLKLIEKYI